MVMDMVYDEGYQKGFQDGSGVVKCKDCKHRPSVKESYDDGDVEGRSLEFPDSVCPCQCEDSWYSWNPLDDFFCARGEKK
jgi:hypothetical protein